MKEAAEKSHRVLCKLAKDYDAILARPAGQLLEACAGDAEFGSQDAQEIGYMTTTVDIFQIFFFPSLLFLLNELQRDGIHASKPSGDLGRVSLAPATRYFECARPRSGTTHDPLAGPACQVHEARREQARKTLLFSSGANRIFYSSPDC